jgi:tight adherence protein C
MTAFAPTDAALAVVLGTALAVGVGCILTGVPRWGAPSLSRRIAPYIRDVTDPAGTSLSSPAPAGVVGLWPALLARAGGLLGASEFVHRRLRQAGWAMDASAFRGRQLAWALTGLLTGAIAAVLLALLGRATPPAAALAPVLAIAGALLCDAHLTRAARVRIRRIQDELPTVLEFLALCLAAGEGVLDALRRVSEAGMGDLTAELRTAVLDVGTGSTLADALSALRARLDVPALTRSLDHVIAALERGAPLAGVLQSQAIDAREDAKRGLIEQAGKREVYMLIPLVFLILPLSVVFAVFPGIFMLRLGLG